MEGDVVCLQLLEHLHDLLHVRLLLLFHWGWGVWVGTMMSGENGDWEGAMVDGVPCTSE